MGRSVITLCVGFGTLAGGFLPALWGNNGFGFAGLACAALGGVAGLVLGLRLSD